MKKVVSIITAIIILTMPMTALAKNHVTVTGSNVTIKMDSGKSVSGKYIPSYRYIKWSKAYLRATPSTGKNVKLTVKQGTQVGLIWTNGKWSAVMYQKNCYFIENAGLALQKPLKAVYTGAYFRKAGAVWWNGRKYTWYSQRVLPDPKNNLGIKGKHLDSQGFICDENDYIALGSNTANRGKIVPTPFGKYGKVYDAGYVGTYWFDCYVGW